MWVAWACACRLMSGVCASSSSTGLVDHRGRRTISLDVLMHDHEELQLGPTVAPLPAVLVRPRGRRIVAVHVNDPRHPVVAITRP